MRSSLIHLFGHIGKSLFNNAVPQRDSVLFEKLLYSLSIEWVQ